MRWFVSIALLSALAGCDRPESTPTASSPATMPQEEKQNSAAPSLSGEAPVMAVTSVTVYASGATHVEHRGTVKDDARLELSFKNGQLAGVLQSMHVQDGEAGRPAAMVQPIESGVEVGAAARKLDLKGNPSLAQLLEQLRGSKVKLQANGDAQEMTILSLEKYERPHEKNDKVVVTTHIVNAMSGNALQSIPLDQIKKIELTDSRIQKDLKTAVESLWKGDPEKKSVAVHLRGQGERAVRLGYTMESKPWKISYRLTLADKPALQAWATVSNDTDVDWNKVQLTLMGGRPLVLAPDAQADASAVSRAAKGAGIPAGEPFRQPRPIPSRDALDEEAFGEEPSPATTPSPTGSPVSPIEGFRYTAKEVSIPSQGTGVIPILADAVTVERVSVYNESMLRRNALQGARLRNTTKHYLLQGTVTVLDEGGYAGDASMENLAPMRYGLVTFGIDLPVLVDASDIVQTSSIQGARINAGVLELGRRHLYMKQYTVENEDQKDRVLVIEHPVRRGWRLVEPAEPMDRTETLYRFRQQVAAGGRTKLLVKEQFTEIEAIDLAVADPQTVKEMARNTEVSPEVREALLKVIAMKQRAAAPELTAQDAQAQLNRISAEQARIRENLKSVDSQSDLGGRYAQQLEAQEKQMKSLNERIVEAGDKQRQSQMQLEDELMKLTVKGDLQ